MKPTAIQDRVSRLLRSFPASVRVVYNSFAKQAHEQYPNPSAKLNRKIIRTTYRTIARRTRLPLSTVAHATNYLRTHKIIKCYKSSNNRRHYYILPPNFWKNPTKSPVSNSVPCNYPKRKVNSTRVVRLSSQLQRKKGKPDKTRTDKTVPSYRVPRLLPFPAHTSLPFLENCKKKILEESRREQNRRSLTNTVQNRTSKTLPVGTPWKRISQGMVLGNEVLTNSKLDEFCVRLVKRTGEASGIPNLDEAILHRRADGRYHPARHHVLTMLAIETQRLGSIRAAMRDVDAQHKGYVARQLQRRQDGLHAYFSVSCWASGEMDPVTKKRTMADTRFAERNRADSKKYDHQVNEEWMSKGRADAATLEQAARDKKQKAEMAKSNPKRAMSIIELRRAFSAGQISLADYNAALDAIERQIALDGKVI